MAKEIPSVGDLRRKSEVSDDEIEAATDADIAAFCQRCHVIHDRSEHQRRRRTLFRRKALGDLFGGPYT